MRIQDIARLVVLAAIWGASFIFMRILAPALGPILTADLRVLIAGVALSIYFAAIRFNPQWKSNWRHYCLIGVGNSAIPFALFSYAALHIPASYSVILNSTSPLFAAIFSAAWLNDRLTARKVVGIFLGFAGVALVAKVGAQAVDDSFILSVLACLIASACYGLMGVYIKRFATSVKPLGIAGGSQLAAGLSLLPLIPFSPMRGELTSFVITNILCFALVCSALAYLLYFRLMEDLGPTKALTVTFLMPVFGMAWGALFLGEQITLGMVGGAALVVFGTFFVLRK
jgi:drug/metabolite transporter (DMT)-like permease